MLTPRDLIDRIACAVGIWALRRLYGECAPENFEPECIACRASSLIRDMREMLHDDWHL